MGCTHTSIEKLHSPKNACTLCKPCIGRLHCCTGLAEDMPSMYEF